MASTQPTVVGTNGTIAARYERMTTERNQILDRAQEASALTVPSLIPPDGHTYSSKLPTPYQSLGARGVNNLSAKLLLILLPTNTPFFRMTIDDYTLEEMAQAEGMRAEVEEALNRIERAVQTKIEQDAIRTSLFEALKHLIVGGNVVLYLPPSGGVRVFFLNQIVCRRSPDGSLLEIIVKEMIARENLTEAIRMALAENKDSAIEDAAPVPLFTHVHLKDGMWHTAQEVAGIAVPESVGTYVKDKSPWIALRWTAIDGENYGRGHVEEYLGDLKSLEGLSKAILEGSAAAAKVLYLVAPNGTTKRSVLAKSESGDVVTGNAQDVTTLQLDKYADFRTAKEMMAELRQELSFAFLLNTAIQRQGERVTAEEIRYMAGELEDTLGGVYSILSQELQLPLVTRLLFSMERSGILPKLPGDKIKPSIVTGLEALGRGHDLNKLDVFLQGLAQQFGPEMVASYMNVDDYIKRRGTALGIDMKGLVKTKEEIAQEQQQNQMQQMLQQFGPDVMKMVGGSMNQPQQ